MFSPDGAGGTTATLTLAGTPTTPLTVDATVTVTITAVALNGVLDSDSTTFDITAAPIGLVAIAGDGVVDLEWDDTVESDLACYSMHRALVSAGPATFLTRA